MYNRHNNIQPSRVDRMETSQVECKGGDLTYGVNVRDPQTQRTSVQRLRKDSGQ